jgi:hypothetical protein
MFVFASIGLKSQYSVGLQANYTTAFSYGFDNFQIDNQGNVYHFEVQTYPRKLKKITPNGYYDTNFGVNGVLTSSLTNPSIADKNYLVTNNGIFFRNDNFIEKFDLSGNLDTSFGNNGILLLETSGEFLGYNTESVFFYKSGYVKKFNIVTGTVDPIFEVPSIADTRLIVTNQNIIYYITNGSTVRKYDGSTGALDVNFGNQGVLISAVGRFIVDTATSNLYYHRSEIIKRYFPNGQLDNTFSVSPQLEFTGFAMINVPEFQSVSTDSSGKLLFFGGNIMYRRAMIIRLLNNGTIDNTFNNGSFYYKKDLAGYIQDVKLVDDNNYICTYSDRLGGSSGYNYGNNKYVRTSTTLSVNEVSNSAISIYPNPVEQYVNIRLEDNEKLLNVEVLSMDGKLNPIDAKDIQNNKVNLGFLPTGNYILNITTNKNKYTQRILKK